MDRPAVASNRQPPATANRPVLNRPLRPGAGEKLLVASSQGYGHDMFMVWSPPPIPQSPSERLALILERLCGALGAHAAKDRSSAPLLVLAWAWLHRLSARFAKLAAIRAGRLAAVPAPRRRADPTPAHPGPWPATAGVPSLPRRLPSGFGWLVRLVPGSAVYGALVQHWLEEPEIAALLKEAPQAGRLLRPLCRMLAIKPGPALSAGRREKSVAASGLAAIPDEGRPDEPSWMPERPRRSRLRSRAVAGADPPPALPFAKA
jgi:hypothetical protein